MDKIFYHGRTQRSPYLGSYIFITDNLEYAAGYSDGKTLYAYKIPFNENLIFSILNNKHLNILKKHIDNQIIPHILHDSGTGNEIDWAALNYIENDDYETPEDLLMSLGFKGVKLKERPEIQSILIFNQNDIEPLGKIDITTPEMIDRIHNYHQDFKSKYNLLEIVRKTIKSYICEQQQQQEEGEKLLTKTHRGEVYLLPDGKIMKLTTDIVEYENAVKILNNPSKYFVRYYLAEPYDDHRYKLIMDKLTKLSDDEYDMVDLVLMTLGRQDYMLDNNKRLRFKQELKNNPEFYEDLGSLDDILLILNTLKNIYSAAQLRNITLLDLRAPNLGKNQDGNIVHFDVGAG